MEFLFIVCTLIARIGVRSYSRWICKNGKQSNSRANWMFSQHIKHTYTALLLTKNCLIKLHCKLVCLTAYIFQIELFDWSISSVIFRVARNTCVYSHRHAREPASIQWNHHKQGKVNKHLNLMNWSIDRIKTVKCNSISKSQIQSTVENYRGKKNTSTTRI